MNTPRNNPLEYDATSPREDELIDDVFEHFAQNNDVDTAEWAIARGVRISQCVKDFGDDRIVSPLLDIARLTGLNELTRTDHGRRAAIRAYKLFAPADEKLLEYTDGILADFHLIDEFLDDKKTEHFLEYPRDGSNPWSRPIEPGNMNDINLLVQTDESKYPGCQGLNIESVLVKAAAALDTIQELSTQENPSEDELLSVVFEIKSFYAPMCELNHYKALAMELKSEATKLAESRGSRSNIAITAFQQAHHDFEIILPPAKYDHLLAESIVKHVFHGHGSLQPSIGHTTHHEISVGSGEIECEIAGKVIEVNARYRRKPEASYAEKQMNTKEKTGRDTKPNDPFGVTLLVDSMDQVETLFGQLGAGIESEDNSHIYPESSQSRDTAYHIAGSDEFLSKMTTAIASDEYSVTIHSRKTTNGFEVAKATFIYHFAVDNKIYAVPCELQIQTRQARDIANAGAASHVFKHNESSYSPSAGEIEAIRNIHDRGNSMPEIVLTSQGKQRAIEFRKRMDQVQEVSKTALSNTVELSE